MKQGFPPIIDEILALAQRGIRPFDKLDRAKPHGAGKKAVESLVPKDLSTSNSTEFQLVKSGLYLYFDCFEEAHEIAQDLEGLHGNWWHAILHRREPDAWNSKYWYARLPIPKDLEKAIARDALESLTEKGRDGLASLEKSINSAGTWQPEAFVDTCAKWLGKDVQSNPYRLLCAIQTVEWRHALKHNIEMVTGS